VCRVARLRIILAHCASVERRDYE